MEKIKKEERILYVIASAVVIVLSIVFAIPVSARTRGTSLIDAKISSPISNPISNPICKPCPRGQLCPDICIPISGAAIK